MRTGPYLILGDYLTVANLIPNKDGILCPPHKLVPTKIFDAPAALSSIRKHGGEEWKAHTKESLSMLGIFQGNLSNEILTAFLM